MAIYITGDTHGGIDGKKLRTKHFRESRLLNKNDYLIVLGDFGIWKDNKSQEFLQWLDNKKFTTLFVEGNHEDYIYLKTFPEISMFGGKVRKISDSIYQLLRGEIYSIDNTTFFSFGGASSIDKAYRKENIDWFKEEECSYLEETYALSNLAKNNNKVDYILSHTCSSSSLDELSLHYGFYINKYDNQNKFFEEVKNTIEYKHWFFGHFHKDLKLSDKETTLYNKILNLADLK